MLNRRWRPVFWSLLAVLGLWTATVIGYSLAKNARVTAEKVQAYASSVDLSQLSGEDRAKAIRKLADLLNRLSLEERRKARLDRSAWEWLNHMSETEKGEFIEATMPNGFKQMLASFEQLPEEKRRKTVDDALRRLRDAQTKMRATEGDNEPAGTNGPPVLSEELQAKIRTIGLKTLYSQSSAQTKAELAPVLEEMQRVMESGRPFRSR
jgi:vacuolar-type H+-ATPase subunit I/STV1